MAEKIVDINGQNVKFKITGLTPVMYMSMYGKDFLAEFIKLEKDLQEGNVQDFMPFYRIAYVLAKKGDESIGSMEEWLESFEDGLPVFDLLQELMPLIQMNFTTQKKPTGKKK